jgi:hypothetical protein
LIKLCEEIGARFEAVDLRRSSWTLVDGRLQPVYWSRLRDALSSLLTEVTASCAVVTRFFDHSFTKAVIGSLIEQDANLVTQIRRQIACSFRKAPPDPEPWNTSPRAHRAVLEGCHWQTKFRLLLKC